MDRFIKYILILSIISASCDKNLISPDQSKAFDKIFGEDLEDIGNDVKQTDDGGYIVVGTKTNPTDEKAKEIVAIKTDQYGNSEWEREYGGSLDDFGKCVLVVPNQGYILFGTHTDTSGIPNKDFLLVKINQNGDTVWSKTYGNLLDQEGKHAHMTSDSGFVLVGKTAIQPNSNQNSIWYLRTDKNGDTLWTKSFTHVSIYEEANFVTAINGNYSLLVGSSIYKEGILDGSNILASIIDLQTGAPQISFAYGGANNDFGYAAAITKSKEFFILGSTRSRGNGGLDIFLIKTAGISKYSIQDFEPKILSDTLVKKTIGGESDEEAFDFTVTNNNEIALVGYSKTYSLGNKDLFLVKTDLDCDTLFMRNFGFIDNEQGNAIIETSDGGFAIAGFVKFEENTMINLVKTNPEGEINME